MGGRVVEGTGLENRQTRKRLEGSNPSPSANYCPAFSAGLFVAEVPLALQRLTGLSGMRTLRGGRSEFTGGGGDHSNSHAFHNLRIELAPI